MSRKLLIFLLLVIVALAGTLGVLFIQPYKLHGSVLQTPKLEAGIFLRSSAGPVRLSDYKGKLALMYFGYTSCPDVCPTSLAKLKMAFSDLTADERSQVQMIFVSVDPDRDTPEKLEQYAHTFGSDFIGASGTRTEIDLITEALGVHYKINPPESDGRYTVDHSSFIYLIDRKGYLVMTWGFDTQPNEISDDLHYLIKHEIPISAQILAGPTQTPPVCSLTLIPGHVDTGKGLYEQNCAECHGMDLGGNPAWQTQLEDGSHLPPPLNQKGAAWKYSEQELSMIVSEGRNLDKPIHMPSFKGKLSSLDIHYILQYVINSWDVNQKNYQAGFVTLTAQALWGSIPSATGTPTP